VSEHEFEPVRGLPGFLPPGERLLWQGSPDWLVLARRALHVRKVALYFALLALWHVVEVSLGGASLAVALRGALWLVVLGAGAIGVLALLGYALARSTVYTITSSRLVLRFGFALPISINLPFSQLDTAGIVRHADGTADIPVSLAAGQRVSYLMTWPHVRPWRFFRVQPTLRCLRDGEQAATLLADALTASDASAAKVAPVRRPTREPLQTGTARPATPAAA
jgi:hypothetical protein